MIQEPRIIARRTIRARVRPTGFLSREAGNQQNLRQLQHVFSFEGLDAARSALQRVDEFTARLREADTAPRAPESPPVWAADTEDRFKAALFNDLNIAEARAALFDLITAGNRALDAGGARPGEARAVLGLLDRMDGVLGYLKAPEASIDPELAALLEARAAARKDKNWAEADRIRGELAARGWAVKDTPKGPKLIRNA